MRQAEELEIYTSEQLAMCQAHVVPRHIAFIPDGNRRWAKKHFGTPSFGHKAGCDNLIKIVKAAKALNVKVVTFYAISTENYLRNPLEQHALHWILDSYLSEQCQTMIDSGIRFQTIGNLSRLPKNVYKTILETKEATAHCNTLDMVLAINYGSRDELSRAMKTMLKDYDDNKLKSEEINEDLISKYLDTAPWPDPDLLIRAGGEQRLSNFLLWQCSYTEIYIADVFWPDFTPQHLLDAVVEFQKRERRLGKI